MKKLTLLIVCIVLLSGCWTPKKVEKFKAMYCHGETTSSKDSTTVTTTVVTPIDTTLYVSKKSFYRALFRCDSLGQIHLIDYDTIFQDDNSSSEINVQGNDVFITCKIDSAKVAFQYNKIHTTTVTKVKEKSKEVIPIITNEPTWWMRTCQYGFYSFLVLLLLYIIYRVIKAKIIIFKKFIP